MEDYKPTYTIFGEKGTEKTTLSFSAFKGKKLCFSFDRKAERIKKYFFNDSPDIVVANALDGYIRTKESITQSAKPTYDSIIDKLKKNIGKFDWVIIDGLEKCSELCEMIMRYEYKLSPFQGIPQMSYWKLRKILLASIHQTALDCANNGVIYTTFSKIEDIYIEDGQVITRKELPRYFDIIEEETDVLLKTYMRDSEEGIRFECKVISSKIPKYKTGAVLNVTRKEVKNAD